MAIQYQSWLSPLNTICLNLEKKEDNFLFGVQLKKRWLSVLQQSADI